MHGDVCPSELRWVQFGEKHMVFTTKKIVTQFGRARLFSLEKYNERLQLSNKTVLPQPARKIERVIFDDCGRGA